MEPDPKKNQTDPREVPRFVTALRMKPGLNGALSALCLVGALASELGWVGDTSSLRAHVTAALWLAAAVFFAAAAISGVRRR